MSGKNYTRETVASFDSYKLETFLWSPPPGKEIVARVLFLHGFAEHCGRFDRQNSYWANAGIEVLAFDQRGFGETRLLNNAQWGKTCWSLQLGDVEWFLASLLSKSPSVPVFLVGHSMGGGLVLAYETREAPSLNAPRIAGVIACSPCLTLPPQMAISRPVAFIGTLVAKFSSSAPGIARIDSSMSCRDAEENAKVQDDPLMKLSGFNATIRQMSDMVNGGKMLLTQDWKRWPVSMPLLVLHGTSDFITSYDSSSEFVNNVAGLGVNAKLVSYEGAYHELAREPEGVKENFSQDTLEWMLERVKNLAVLSSTQFKSNI